MNRRAFLVAMTFPSKVDTWLYAVLIGSAVFCTVIVLAPLAAGSPATSLAISPVLLVTVGLPLWLLRATHYTLDGTDLRVRSGPFRWRVPLREIHEVRPTRNPLSSPALSLDRLRIDYGRGRSIMISPRDREAFLERLEAQMRAVGDRSPAAPV